jgi:two-component system chemotaxis response regulator CheB
MKILIAEDDLPSTVLLKRIVKNAGHECGDVRNGADALALLEAEHVDVLLTDWMMPGLDGIELIEKTRARLSRPPFIVLITAIGSPEAMHRALEAGADEFLAKPYGAQDVLAILERGLAKIATSSQRFASAPRGVLFDVSRIAIGIAASTGGPPAIRTVIEGMGHLPDASVFIVLHGPAWMLSSYADRLRSATSMHVSLGADGMQITAGAIYLAPGDHHMVVNHDGTALALNQNPAENYVRPAADPLFRSLAEAYGSRCIISVLTGLGRDGTIGSGYVSAAGGFVIAQDPRTAVMPSMPQTVVDLRVAHDIQPLEEIGPAIARRVSTVLHGVMQ